jgi:hypothetical protein
MCQEVLPANIPYQQFTFFQIATETPSEAVKV